MLHAYSSIPSRVNGAIYDYFPSEMVQKSTMVLGATSLDVLSGGRYCHL